MEATEIAIVIGAVSALIVAVAGVFMKYLNSISKGDSKERLETAKINADALKMISKALDENTASNRRIADEAKERNGHLAELSMQNQEEMRKHYANVPKLIDCAVDKINKKEG